jgi:hypothetical protein
VRYTTSRARTGGDYTTTSDAGEIAAERLFGSLKTQLTWNPDSQAMRINVRQLAETQRGVEVKVGPRRRAAVVDWGRGRSEWPLAAAGARAVQRSSAAFLPCSTAGAIIGAAQRRRANEQRSGTSNAAEARK